MGEDQENNRNGVQVEVVTDWWSGIELFHHGQEKILAGSIVADERAATKPHSEKKFAYIPRRETTCDLANDVRKLCSQWYVRNEVNKVSKGDGVGVPLRCRSLRCEILGAVVSLAQRKQGSLSSHWR